MEDYAPLKMKRKDIDEVIDDFSEFYLSSPARKIRRLDAELPPIIEEEDADVSSPVWSEFPVSENNSSVRGIRIEELPSENEERAIVLFNRTNNSSYLHSPSNISVDPELISGFKNQILRPHQSSSWRPDSDDAEAETTNSDSSNGCLAVVPWVPSKLPPAPETEVPSQFDNGDMMEDEQMEEASMDVEDSSTIDQRYAAQTGGMIISEGLHQWQQQHCMFPHPPQNMTTPVVWYQ